MRTEPGVTLGGRYRLVRRIAVGGMGEVWSGYDEALARDVAVKVLREEFAGDPGFLERFRVEARNSAALSHPNIAQLFDYGEQQGTAYLVMELVVGEPLADLLERQPVLETQRVVRILAQSARALHAAHEAGVVHRDVKPGNMLLGRGGRVKLTDFGVSIADNQMTMTATGMVMGTAQYLSPEQAIGKVATPLSDLYSLGVVGYEALVGHRPFTGPTAVDIAVAHVNSPVPPLPPSVDKRLGALVMALLSKDPAARPPSGEVLAQTLEAMIERTPPSGVPVVVGPRQRTPDPYATARATAAPVPGQPAPVTPPGAPSTRREAGGARPPSYPPKRDRDRTAPPSHVAPAPPRTPPRGRSPVAGSGVSRPLLALILLLVALLGAALADRLTSSDASGAGSDRVIVSDSWPQRTGVAGVDRYPRAGTPGGMITHDDRSALLAHGLTTTAKDA